MNDLYLTFDGHQLRVRTDVPEVFDFVATLYAPVLVEKGHDLIGELIIDRERDGYTLRGAWTLRVQGEPRDIFLAVKSDITHQFVASRPDLFWLHAGAVEREGLVLLLSGPPRRGKSTLVSALCVGGWRLMADDVTALDMKEAVAIPFAQAPAPRIAPVLGVSSDNLYALPRAWPAPYGQVSPYRRGDVKEIVFPRFDPHSPPGLVRLKPGDAAIELLRNCLNRADHKSEAVDRAAALAREVSCYSLTFGEVESAVRMIDSTIGSSH